MPDDSGGNNSLPPGYLAVTGQQILASQHNPSLEDLSASMTRRYMRDGRAPMLGNVPMNGYRATGAGAAVDAQDYVTLAQVQALIAAVQGVPAGVMVPFTGNTIPASWLAVNGQTVSRATYAALYAHAAASGNMAASEGVKTVGQFGPGDGSTTFSLPNLYSGTSDGGYFIRPISSGRTIGSVQTDTAGPHTHPALFAGVPVPGHTHNTLDISGAAGNVFGNGTSTSGVGPTSPAGAHTPSGTVTVQTNTGVTETRPKNISYPVIIKT